MSEDHDISRALLDELQRAKDGLRLLSRSNQAIIQIEDRQELLKEVCRIAVQEGRYRMAWIGMAEDDEPKAVRPVESWGLEGGYLDATDFQWSESELGAGPVGSAIRTRRPVIIEDVTADPAFEPWLDEARQRGYASALSFPLLLNDGTCFGALTLYSERFGRPTDLELDVLQELASDLAFGLHFLRTKEAREERLKRTFEFAPIGMALVSTEGRWLQVNPALSEMLGYRSDELLDLTFQDITHPDDLDADLANVRKVLDGEIATYQMMKRYIHKDGDEIWGHLSVSLVRDDEGKPAYFISQIQDLTERKRAEDELRRQERDYRTTVGTIPGVVYRRTSEWRGRFLGDPEDLCGYTEHEISELDGAWRAIVHPEDRERVESEGAKLLESPQRMVQTYRIVTKNQETKWVEDHKVSRFSSEGDFEEIMGVIVDETDRKTLEHLARQAQKMEVVGQFAGGLAHDFNNLLTVIMAEVDLQLTVPDQDEESFLESLRQIRAAAEQGSAITRQLLSFSRRQILRMAPIRIEEVIRDVQQSLARLLPESIGLWVEIADKVPQVRGDGMALKQVLLNLAKNASDAMDGVGRLSFVVDTDTLTATKDLSHGSLGRGEYLLISISDTGHGITPEHLEDIFEPFFTTKSEDRGTGLGLSMAWGIIAEHGGGIHVDSEVGQGTTFTLYIPTTNEAPDPEPAQKSDAPDQEPTDLTGSETLLFVDDSESIRRSGSRFLERLGYSVLTSANGREALHKLQAHKGSVHLAIADVVMPEMGGPELRSAALEEGINIPFVFTSGHSSEQLSALSQGIEDSLFLEKPWTLEDLAKMVRTALADQPGS